METWRLYTYDVWGNADDGFEVNDMFPKQQIELPDNASDADVITALEKSCGGPCTGGY